MARTHLAPVATLFFVAGCSALGLADGLEQSPCMACSELNAIEPTGDRCLSWQCSNIDDPMAGVCVVGTLDEDEDGSPSSMCVMDGTEDCDDDDPDNRPGVDEVCDLADSDCDGKIDEGALALDRSDLTSAASLDALSWGEGDMEVVAIYNQGGDLEAAHLPFSGASGGSDTLVGLATNPDPLTTAVARTGSDWAIAYAPRTGCSRIVLGTWSGTGTSLSMPSGHDVSGLPKPGGECPTDTSAVGHPSLASAVARQVLVAYLADSDARSCGGAAADVGLVVVQRATGGTFGDAGATASDVLGQSVDGAPALVAIDGTYGYLLAFARDDGTIGVHRVQVDGTTRATTVTPDVYVETCGGACGDVSLRAVAVDSGYEVALTYRDGDCTEAAAALRVLSLDPTGETIRPIGDRHVSSSATTLRRPVAARRTGPDEWLVIYSYNAGPQRAVAMQRWSADGVSVGDARDLLTTSGVFSQPIAATGGTGVAGYRVFAYDSDADMLARASAQCTTPAP